MSLNSCKIAIAGFIFLFFLTPNLIWSQVESNDSTQLSDTLTETDYEFSFFMFDFNYTNNKAKTKDQADETIPAFIGDATFLHKTGLYAGFMYTSYLNADTSSYDIDLQAGFQKYFFDDFRDIDLNYTYHEFAGMNDFNGIDYNHAINASTGITYEMLYLSGDGNFYLDNKNYFTSFSVGILLDFENVLTKDDFLFIQPTVSVNQGTDYWLYELYEPYIQNVLLPILKFRGYQTENITTEDIVERYLRNNGLSTNTYTYQGVDFLVPISYGINSISATFSWMYYIPSDKLKAFGMKDQSGFLISLSFIF
jgi:hypothetical protein